ncbi:MAG: right-handed parallel beta-helix repeat-containing protein [Phycisphaerales bacterium]|nr:right-handed parallel beta-helix repeat-containing protein [Phycisphaerales bacterium]
MRKYMALWMTMALGTAATAVAGPLNPPPGPVASTMKTLDQVEPRVPINQTNTPGTATTVYRITQPGSYYLTGKVAGENARHGIEIAASGVTIDLNGFEVLGKAGSLNGITISISSLSNICVRNGSVRNWGSHGIDLSENSARGIIVEGVSSTDNGGHGIFLRGAGSVSRCTATRNGQHGIFAFGGVSISDCAALENLGNGFQATLCTVTGCTSVSNAAHGFDGAGTQMSHCAASFNEGNGFDVIQSSVTHCEAGSNDGDGILAVRDCVITDNQCNTNGFMTADGANIHVTGGGNRIEGNNCIEADRGIDVDAAGNVIIKNTCSDNTTNWDIFLANKVGVIVVAPPSGAILGNSGGTGMGTTDPWANFTY